MRDLPIIHVEDRYLMGNQPYTVAADPEASMTYRAELAARKAARARTGPRRVTAAPARAASPAPTRRERAARAAAELDRIGPARGLASVRLASEDDPRAGFRSVVEFMGAVRRACQPGAAVGDPRLLPLYARGDGELRGADWLSPSKGATAPTGFMERGGTVGEGYLIPDFWRSEILDIIYAADDIAGRVFSEPTGRSEVRAPIAASTPWETIGVQCQWKREGEALIATPPKTRQALMELLPLYCFITAPEGLVADSPRLASRIQGAVGPAFQWTLSESFMHDSGAARPHGWLRAPALVEVAKESGQSADTIVSANVLNMFSRRLLTPAAEWVWLTSSTALPQLFDLQSANGNALFRQGSGAAYAPAGAMLGIPVETSEHCPVLGDAGDLQLANLGGYYAPRHDRGVLAASSVHVYFDYFLEAFRFMIMTQGAPLLSAPVAPAHGSDTRSHFISLGERA